jgi:hypothetical protein
VTNRIESCLRLRMYEGVGLRVAVEADAETVRVEYPVKFGIRADNSRGIIVVCKRAAVSIPVAAEIGRVRTKSTLSLGRARSTAVQSPWITCWVNMVCLPDDIESGAGFERPPPFELLNLSL